MNILITGAAGFIGKNLSMHLREKKVEPLEFGRTSDIRELEWAIVQADAICHLAGVNRPADVAEFAQVNTGLTATLCRLAEESGRKLPILLASSIQAESDNPYGRSKRDAEDLVLAYGRRTGAAVKILRLPNVFGKWCKPNYNSVVATFCHHIARDLPITVNDPAHPLQLVYIDDVVDGIVGMLDEGLSGEAHGAIEPVYGITLGELAATIQSFRASRESQVTERVGGGLVRALYSTYVSYLPSQAFSYPVPMHADPRGVFVEMLKTRDSGQFSFFTAPPGVTRGGHYHHSKTEKFLVIQGKAKFRFRQLDTGEYHELCTSGEKAEIVETIPGWTHDITNIGEGDMIVMLWANEIFDRGRPDTFSMPL
ncbi:MAG: NAD-dependent epimerase/dehydratase family protein [Candidatus Protistobacter heckmanni]|nr:NAD-dependent epimerase/dehydratase family protein [Candidatus Protistobacter heckmanni]